MAITAGLMLALAGVAHAQVDYDYYGVVDLSYARLQPSGLEAEKRLNSNSLSPSFFGLTGSYGFDGGWSVAAVAETFLRFQDMETGRKDTDPFLSRNAFVTVRGPYGNVRYGRMQTLLFDTTNRFNALGNSPLSPAIRQLFQSGTLEGVQGDFYWDRAISYTSPTLEGVTVNAVYATQKKEAKGHYGAGSVVWSIGLAAIELSTQTVRVDDGISDATKEVTWQLGATYNFGFLKVFGLYTQINDRGLEVGSKLSSAGFSLPLGPGSVLAQAGTTTAEGPAVDRKHTSISAAYVYPYDSNLDIYVIGMDDRIRGQEAGQSAAAGIRFKF